MSEADDTNPAGGGGPTVTPAPEVRRIRIGDELQSRGLLTDVQLQVALAEQRRVHRPLGEILIGLGFVREQHMASLMAEQLGLPLVDADELDPDPMVLAAIDTDFVRSSRAFPVRITGGVLDVVMVDPTDPVSVETVRTAFPYALSIRMVTVGGLDRLMRQHLGSSRSNEVGSMLSTEGNEEEDGRVTDLCNAMIRDGIRRGATDIHVQPEERLTRVRYRIDGVLRNAENLPEDVSDAVVSRLKINAGLDIAEHRRPQDGRIRMHVDGRDVDLRMSVMPNIQGENVVLRVLDRSGGVPPLEQLGVEPETAGILAGLAERPHGLFLVTGPTGSGKTTTLYALLSRVDSIQRNVATIEDPVEYSMPLVRQSQVDASVGYGFHEGLRALLRQDPDVILVGEIRDEVTADMAIKAAMTGHLVLATLHTTNALGAVPRLVDLGVPSYLLEESLLAVMGQRLVRKLCDRCSTQMPLGHPDYAITSLWLEGDMAEVKAPVGCDSCDGTGFAGRVAVAELFVADDSTSEAIRQTGQASPTESLEEAALRAGYQDIGFDAREKVRRGLTSLSEVLRIHRPAGIDEAMAAFEAGQAAEANGTFREAA